MAILWALLGILCIIGGVSVMLLNSGTLFFAIWYVLGAVSLAVAWALHTGFWGSLPLLLRRGLIGVAGFLVALLVGTQALILSQINAQGSPNLDYLIVLGAQIYDDGSPSAVLRYRLDAALEYLKENPDTVCIVSGGKGPNEPYPEADGMAQYLQRQGISADRVIREGRSKSTLENVVNSMALMAGPDCSVGIVTNNFHVYRAVKIAEKAGLRNVCGIAAQSTPVYLPNNLLRESIGLVKDLLVGNI